MHPVHSQSIQQLPHIGCVRTERIVRNLAARFAETWEIRNYHSPQSLNLCGEQFQNVAAARAAVYQHHWNPVGIALGRDVAECHRDFFRQDMIARDRRDRH